MWEEPTGSNKLKVLQCWFPGVHTNVGGGYPDAGNSNITLAWMMSQLQGLLDFDEDYIDYLHQLQVQHEVKKGKTVRSGGLGSSSIRKPESESLPAAKLGPQDSTTPPALILVPVRKLHCEMPMSLSIQAFECA